MSSTESSQGSRSWYRAKSAIGFWQTTSERKREETGPDRGDCYQGDANLMMLCQPNRGLQRAPLYPWKITAITIICKTIGEIKCFSRDYLKGFLGGSNSKESACDIEDPGSIAGSGRPPGEGNGNPLQYSCPENPMDRGAWWATVHGAARSWTSLSS